MRNVPIQDLRRSTHVLQSSVARASDHTQLSQYGDQAGDCRPNYLYFLEFGQSVGENELI